MRILFCLLMSLIMIFSCLQLFATAEEKTKQNLDENVHRILVAYFSATGNTKALAEKAADYLNADIYEIIPETPYTDDDLEYSNSDSRATSEQNDDNCRPEIKNELPDMDKYDTLVIAHPIWWGQAPKIIYTFLEGVDTKDKTIVTFCTSGSSGVGTSAENLKAVSDKDSVWLESKRFPAETDKEELKEWFEGIGIEPEEETKMLKIEINSEILYAKFADTEAANELKEKLSKGPISINMSGYGGFEQVGDLGFNLTTNDKQTTTSTGDIVLYCGNKIVMFYGSNSWSYTRIGHINNTGATEIKEILGKGDVKAVLSITETNKN